MMTTSSGASVLVSARFSKACVSWGVNDLTSGGTFMVVPPTLNGNPLTKDIPKHP